MKILAAILLLSALSSTGAAQADEHPWVDERVPDDKRVQSLIDAMTVAEKMAQLQADAPGVERLGILPYNWWNEALHGVARSGRATVFPQPIGMAATFDEELIHRVATAISDEARAKFNIAQKIGNYGKYAGLTFWSPNVNIFRDPRWGRGMETYGEDPYLQSRLGTAFVKGLQGDDPKHMKAAACAKHYAVHSGPEKLRHEFDAIAPKRDIAETYLPAFEALVKEGRVECVMCAYNRVDGEPACGSQLLLQEILRDDWGFEGHVVSDCGAVRDFHKRHKVAAAEAEAARLAAIQAEKDKNYADAVARADNLFTEKEYENSRNEYRTALDIKPDEAYPQQRIDEIAELLAQLSAAQKAYEEAVALRELKAESTRRLIAGIAAVVVGVAAAGGGDNSTTRTAGNVAIAGGGSHTRLLSSFAP